MKDMVAKDVEYLVRRHELLATRHYMPALGHALVATSEAGLGNSIQALIRVIFGYQPDIRIVRTAGGVLDGFTENASDMTIVDEQLFLGSGIDFVSFLEQCRNSSRFIVISRALRPRDILALRKTGVADVIHPTELDSARLAEAYIRVCVLSVLAEQDKSGSEGVAAEVIALEPRSTQPVSGIDRAVEKSRLQV